MVQQWTPRRDHKWLEAIDCVNVISDELLHELHRNKLQKQVHGASLKGLLNCLHEPESNAQKSLRLCPCSQAGREETLAGK